ncbi:MAG: hypothetical protein WCF18_23335 [Chthoniobacteraceae bacterium]
MDYDFLILAMGASHNYFWHEEFVDFAPGLKNLNEATTMHRACSFLRAQTVLQGAPP